METHTEQMVKTENTIFKGDPVEDMEIAKGLIAKHPKVDFGQLMAIAADRNQSPSARVAAIYTLGFTDDKGLSSSVLSRIIADPEESAHVKDYATEALNSITHH